MTTKTIIDFERPPVVETVVGVQFDPIPSLRNAHFGAYWALIQETDEFAWPAVNDAPPIGQEFERFGDAARFAGEFQVQFTNDPSARTMIMSRAKDRLIQLQNGRFHLNWLGHDGREYVRYAAVRQSFDTYWALFSNYLKDQVGASPKLNQWEVTYVNFMHQGTVWETPEHLTDAFTFVGTNVRAECGPLESVSTELRFEIAPKRGRLRVRLNPGFDKQGRPIFNLTLVARGPIGGDGVESYGEGLDLGRESIDRAFASLTTDKARKTWGEKDAASTDVE